MKKLFVASIKVVFTKR